MTASQIYDENSFFFDKELVMMMKINWANFGSSSSYSLREIQSQSKTVSHFQAENWQGEYSCISHFFHKTKAKLTYFTTVMKVSVPD